MTTKKKPVAKPVTKKIEPKAETITKPTGYAVGKWKIYDFFQCLTCDYNTLVEPDMIEHQTSHGKAG